MNVEKIEVPDTHSGIQHVIFSMDDDQQKLFVEAPVVVPTKEEANRLFKEIGQQIPAKRTP